MGLFVFPASSFCMLSLWNHQQTFRISCIHIIPYPPTRPSPRQGRRLGPPEVWNLLCHGHGLHIVQGRSCNKCLSVFKRFAKLQRPHLPAHSPLLLRHSNLPFARLQTLKTLTTLKTLQLPRGSFRQLPPSPLAVSFCCSSIAACPLPAHSPLLLGHSSLPFARLQTLKTLKTLQFPRGSFHQALWPSAFPHLPAHSPLLLGHSSLPFARLQTLKTLKTLKTLQLPRLQTLKTLKTLKTLQFPRGSFHQALWPSAFAAFACA